MGGVLQSALGRAKSKKVQDNAKISVNSEGEGFPARGSDRVPLGNYNTTVSQHSMRLRRGSNMGERCLDMWSSPACQ